MRTWAVTGKKCGNFFQQVWHVFHFLSSLLWPVEGQVRSPKEAQKSTTWQSDHADSSHLTCAHSLYILGWNECWDLYRLHLLKNHVFPVHIHSYTYKPRKLAAKCASRFMEKIPYLLADTHLSNLLIQRSSKEQLLRATQDKLTNSGL